MVPETTVSAEFEMEKNAPRAVEYLLQVRAVPVSSYHGAQDTTIGGHSARDCANELASFEKNIKFMEASKIMCDTEKN